LNSVDRCVAVLGASIRWLTFIYYEDYTDLHRVFVLDLGHHQTIQITVN